MESFNDVLFCSFTHWYKREAQPVVAKYVDLVKKALYSRGVPIFKEDVVKVGTVFV